MRERRKSVETEGGREGRESRRGLLTDRDGNFKWEGGREESMW